VRSGEATPNASTNKINNLKSKTPKTQQNYMSSPKNHPTSGKQTTSSLRESYIQSPIIKTKDKKSPARSRGFSIKVINPLERRIYA
jgi:hypothetical protein